MIYTIHTCTVKRFSQALRNPKYISRVWLPKRIAEKLLAKLVLEYNKSKVEEAEELQKLGNEYYRTSLYIRILIFEIILEIFSHGWDEKGNELYREYFGADYNEKTLKSKLKRLQVQYEAEQSNVPNDGKKLDFDELITGLELILDIDLSNKFLYQLPYYEKKALDKVKSRENGRTEQAV